MEFGQINLDIWTNTFCDLNKYTLQFEEIHRWKAVGAKFYPREANKKIGVITQVGKAATIWNCIGWEFSSWVADYWVGTDQQECWSFGKALYYFYCFQMLQQWSKRVLVYLNLFESLSQLSVALLFKACRWFPSCWRNEQITTNDGDEKAHNHKTGFSPTTDPIRQQCKKEEEGAQTEADI